LLYNANYPNFFFIDFQYMAIRFFVLPGRSMTINSDARLVRTNSFGNTDYFFAS
jgi:hypothetical protein